MNRGVIKLSIHEVEILKSMNLLSGHKLLALEQLQTSDSILQNIVQNPQKHNHNQNQNSPNQDHNYNQQQNAQHNNQNLQQNPQDQKYITVEFSADEVEYILDEIGIPKDNENVGIKILRGKFFLFNSQLRGQP